MNRYIFIIIILISQILALNSVEVYAQNIDAILSDSLFTFSSDSLTFSDSLNIPDSLNISDSLKQKTSDDLDAIVFANAKDSLIFNVKAKEMYLYGQGDIKYKETELQSGNIKVNFETSNLEAIGREDFSDSANVTIVETPVLKEASDTYEGTSIKYNFKTQKGFISLAKNSADNKTYTGQKVKKVDKKTFFIDEGQFTTCDADTPHYYFGADRMKIIQGDKIIAKWIFMYIGGVPIPIPLPWGVFPNKTGRASGIIAPTYGNDGTLGWYLRNMGYFYVINDYADFTVNGDYYFKGGYGVRSRMRYKKRYSYNGNINGGFSNRISNETGDPDYSELFNWNINVNHHQKITPTMQLDARLQFMSSDYLEYNSPNIADRVQQDIVSNATLSKRWDGSGMNLSINYNRTQNLESGDITEDLPSVSFSKSRVYPFRSNSGSSKDMGWYEKIGFDYSGKFRNNRKKDVIDSTTTEHTIHGGLDHRVNISASPKFGYISLSPSVSLSSKWYNKRQIQDINSYVDTSRNDTTIYFVDQYDVNELNTVNTFNFNLSASTKLYGMAQPQILGVSAFRHTFEPRITYSYRPDFSKEKWGYYDTYVDEDGNIIEYDKFGNQIFGGASNGESQRLSLSLGNIFEIKTIKDPTDTTSESHKIKLLDVGISSGYNFAADSLQYDDISLSFRTQIGRMLTLHGSSTLSPYIYSDGSQINELLIGNSGFLHLTSFNMNLSSSLSQDLFAPEEEKKKGEEEIDEFAVNNEEEGDYIELYKDQEPDFAIPWNLNMTYNYNFTDRNLETGSTKRSNFGFDLSFNLTQKWKITFRGSYDITNDKMNAPQVTIYRDLHAWEANMLWNPIGTYRGFKFEIRLKAPEFRDLKLSKSKDIYSGY